MTIDLSAAAIEDLNAALGQWFAVGGALISIDELGGLQDEYLFGFSGFSNIPGPRLVLATVPEPGTAGLLLLGLFAFGLSRRR